MKSLKMLIQEASKEYGNVLFGQRKNNVGVDKTEPEDEKLEREVFLALRKFFGSNTEFPKKLIPSLLKAKKLFKNEMKSPDVTLYRGIRIPIKKAAEINWKAESDTWWYSDNEIYKGHRTLSSWSEDIEKAFKFSRHDEEDLGMSFYNGSYKDSIGIILEAKTSKNKARFLFSRNLMSILSPFQNEKEIISINSNKGIKCKMKLHLEQKYRLEDYIEENK